MALFLTEKAEKLLNERKKTINKPLQDKLERELIRFSDAVKPLILNLVKTLNPAQLEAVIHNHELDGQLLILAGAGSGKTAVLTRRLVYLILRGVEPKKLLAVTFTNKAAAEMGERVEKLLKDISKDTNNKEVREKIEGYIEDIHTIWIATFHSAALRILREEVKGAVNITRVGYNARFRIPDNRKVEELLKMAIESGNIPLFGLKPKDIYERINVLKGELVELHDFRKKAKTKLDRAAVRLWENYSKLCRKYSYVDFSDMLYLLNQLFDKFPDIKDYYARKFQYIHVDEYQDTNESQYVITTKLVAGKKTFFVVGDDNQSIYGWRGADIRNILNFKRDYPECSIVKLETNYRSTGAILEAANNVFNKKPAHMQKILNVNTINKDVRFLKDEHIVYHTARTDKDEARYVCKQIEKMVDTGLYDYKDFAILYRINSQSLTFVNFLEARDIPYHVIGPERSLITPEISLIKVYLEFLLYLQMNENIKHEKNTDTLSLAEQEDELLKEIIKKPPLNFETKELTIYEKIQGVPDGGKYELLTDINELEELESKKADFQISGDEKKVQEIIGRIRRATQFRNSISPEMREKIKEFTKLIEELLDIITSGNYEIQQNEDQIEKIEVYKEPKHDTDLEDNNKDVETDKEENNQPRNTGPVYHLIYRIIQKFDFFNKLEQERLRKNITALQWFLKSAHKYETEHISIGDPIKILQGFFDELTLKVTDSQNEGGQDNQNQVVLLTLHSAKGLEFPVVFFVGLEEKICPYEFPGQNIARSERKKLIEEEQRLFYVGITRAQYKLYLVNAISRKWFGRIVELKPSRFLKAMPDSVVDKSQFNESIISKIFRIVSRHFKRRKMFYLIALLLTAIYLINNFIDLYYNADHNKLNLVQRVNSIKTKIMNNYFIRKLTGKNKIIKKKKTKKKIKRKGIDPMKLSKKKLSEMFQNINESLKKRGKYPYPDEKEYFFKLYNKYYHEKDFEKIEKKYKQWLERNK